ncbi:MAG: DNA alkylation repair protein [Sulfitobacter sp.]
MTPLKDQLFNDQTVAQLAAEHARGIDGFDAVRFTKDALGGFPERELMARMEWLADCLEPQLSADFSVMADQLEAAMPPPLSLDKTDDDFGHFIHAIPGILAARHGLVHHRARAMALLHAATQRFSMEFAIRSFLLRWPEETLADLAQWVADPNYHVRRLVSEGTRPRLPWGNAVRLQPEQTLPLLEVLHADPARFVTRSVANHLNDLCRIDPDAVLAHLAQWREQGAQSQAELDWMRRHALRNLIKQGHSGALAAMGYRADAVINAEVVLEAWQIPMDGTLAFKVVLECAQDMPILVDYRIEFPRANGKTVQKVFKLKTSRIKGGVPLEVTKRHVFKPDATTFKLFEGLHKITVQVNGCDVACAAFTLTKE